MVVNTVIDLGGSKKPPLSPTKPRVVALNLTGEAMRQHQSLMEARAKINVLNSNLASAMASLETANRDIDRLNAEMARMKTEWQKEIDDLKDALRTEREKNARLSKKKGKVSEASGDSGDSK